VEQIGRVALGVIAGLIGCSAGRDGSERVRQGALSITRVVAPAPLTAGGAMSVYFTVTNSGSSPDTLTAITTPVARAAMAHDQVTHGGMAQMTMLPLVIVPAGGSVSFAPGGKHVMLEGLTRAIAPGTVVPLRLRFARAGTVAIDARVVSYDRLDAALRR